MNAPNRLTHHPLTILHLVHCQTALDPLNKPLLIRVHPNLRSSSVESSRFNQQNWIPENAMFS